MINIIIHWRNVNQNHSELQLHSHHDGWNKNTDNNKYWQGCREIGILIHFWQDYKMEQFLWKIAFTIFQNIKWRNIIWPWNALPKIKIYIHRKTYKNVHLASFRIVNQENSPKIWLVNDKYGIHRVEYY